MSLELYRTVIAISVVVTSSVIIYVAYAVVSTLKKLMETIELINENINEINFVKNGIKMTALTIASGFINYLQKGGERN